MMLRIIQTLLIFTLLSTSSITWANLTDPLAAVDRSIRQRDYQQAVKLLGPLLKQNNAIAQFRMAGLYRAGKGIKRNQSKAIEYYEKAALNGHIDAQYTLASLLEKSQPDDDRVVFWYQVAADQGNTLAKAKT